MRVNDAIIGLIAIVIGLAVLIHVQSFPAQAGGRPGPALFPSGLSVLFIISGIVLILQERCKSEHQPWFERLPELNVKGIGNILVTLLAVVFYIFVSETIGFLLTSFIVMIALSCVALLGNAASLYFLRKSKTQEVHIKATQIFTSNDVIVNIGVVISGRILRRAETEKRTIAPKNGR